MMKKYANYLPWVVTFLMSLFFIAINSDSTSPLFWGIFCDSSVFQYMGYSILQGKIPYTDLFDHKGLLLYCINALGYLIHPKIGVMLLQTLNLTLTMMVWYKILNSIKTEWMKYLILTLALLGLYAYFDGGNLEEEWCLVFISYPILAYFESKKNGNVFSNRQLFAIGFCLGAIAMIRLNIMAPVLSILFYCLIEALWKKEYQYIGRAFKWSFLGFVIFPVLGCIYMFYLNGFTGLDDMFYATVLFNLDYASNSHIGSHLFGEYNYIYKAMLPMLFLLLFFYQNRRDVLVLCSSFMLTVLSLGGFNFYHYLILFIPLLVASFRCIDSTKIRYTAIILLALLYSKTLYHQFDWSHFFSPKENLHVEAFNKVIAPIPESKRNDIWNMASVYLITDFMNAKLVQHNRMIIPWQMSFSNRLYQEENSKIQQERPDYVIYALYAEKWRNDPCKYNKKHANAESEADLQFVLDNYEVLSTAQWPDGTKLFCYHLKRTLDNE